MTTDYDPARFQWLPDDAANDQFALPQVSSSHSDTLASSCSGSRKRTADALERLMQTCMATLIADGIVTRIPADVDQKMPEFARLVQQGKSWAMAPYASRAMIPALEIRTRYSDEGFAAYHRLWPFSSLLTNVSR